MLFFPSRAIIFYENAIEQGKSCLLYTSELIVDTVPEELEEVKAILKEQMEHVCEMAVPLKVHTAVGKNWAEAK